MSRPVALRASDIANEKAKGTNVLVANKTKNRETTQSSEKKETFLRSLRQAHERSVSVTFLQKGLTLIRSFTTLNFESNL